MRSISAVRELSSGTATCGARAAVCGFGVSFWKDCGCKIGRSRCGRTRSPTTGGFCADATELFGAGVADGGFATTGRCGWPSGRTGLRGGAFRSRTIPFGEGAFGIAFTGTVLKSAGRTGRAGAVRGFNPAVCFCNRSLICCCAARSGTPDQPRLILSAPTTRRGVVGSACKSTGLCTRGAYSAIWFPRTICG